MNYKTFKVDKYYFVNRVDNHTSTLISNNINHFIGIFLQIKHWAVKGYKGMFKVRGKSTIK